MYNIKYLVLHLSKYDTSVYHNVFKLLMIKHSRLKKHLPKFCYNTTHFFSDCILFVSWIEHFLSFCIQFEVVPTEV
jgi:hypothetical protein